MDVDMFDALERDTAPARRTDPQTSQDAAVMPFRRTSQRYRLLEAYMAHPDGLTDEQAAVHAGILTGCPWKRSSELRETMGASQQVCKVNSAGLRITSDLTSKSKAG
jgi:hypothetical protein